MFRQYLLLTDSAALVSVMSACTSTTADELVPDNRLPVAFSASADINSRAVTTDSENFTEKPFAVWGSYISHNTSGTPVKVFDNVEVKYEVSSWTYQDTQYWLPGMDYRFAALHPAANGATDVTFDMTGGLSFGYTVTPDTDLLGVATDTKSCTGIGLMGPVELKFNHLQARVQFVVKRAPGLSRDLGIIIDAASFSGVYTSAVYNVTAGNIRCTVQGSLSGAVAANTNVTVPADATKGVDLFGYVFVLPVNVPVGDSGATFTMTYTYSDAPGEQCTYSCKLADLSPSWQPGLTYRYTLEIGADDYILFSKPEVIPWEETGGTNIIIQGDHTA